MKNKQFQGFVSRKENWNKDLFLRISMIETRANSPFFNCSKKCKKINLDPLIGNKKRGG